MPTRHRQCRNSGARLHDFDQVPPCTLTGLLAGCNIAHSRVHLQTLCSFSKTCVQTDRHSDRSKFDSVAQIKTIQTLLVTFSATQHGRACEQAGISVLMGRGPLSAPGHCQKPEGGGRLLVLEQRGGVRLLVLEQRGGARLLVSEQRGGARLLVLEQRRGCRLRESEPGWSQTEQESSLATVSAPGQPWVRE